LFEFVYNVNQVYSFKAAHWVWDYSLGFIKRGLVGEIMEIAFGSFAKKYSTIEIASTIVCLAAYLSYILFSAHVARMRPYLITVGVAITGAILTPALPSFAHDLGRFDQMNFIIFVIVCFIIVNASLAVSCFALAILPSIAILVHEAFLVLQFPTLIGIAFLRFYGVEAMPARVVIPRMLLASTIPISTLIIIITVGSAPVEKSVWIDHWLSQAPFTWDQVETSFTIHYTSLSENIAITKSYGVISAFVGSFITLILFSYVAFTILADLLNEWAILPNVNAIYVLLLGLYSPLLMYLVGMDFMRWAHIIVINVVMSLLSLIRIVQPEVDNPVEVNATKADALQNYKGKSYFHPILFSIAYVYLMFPQASGEDVIRPFPVPFACIMQSLDVNLTMPEEITCMK